MTTLLVTHGTRNPHCVKMIGDLAAAVAGVLDETVRVAFVDVLGPAADDTPGWLPSQRAVNQTGRIDTIAPERLRSPWMAVGQADRSHRR
jgi:hypothetical protein